MRKEKQTYCLLLMSCFLLFSACKKPAERVCLKSIGAQVTKEIPIDSVNHFNLYTGITYRVVQDDERKIVIKGGENLVDFIDVKNEDLTISIENLNKCDFLRSYDQPIEVEIHYPYYASFYADISDSLVFEDTIRADKIAVEMRHGGGSAKMHVEAEELVFVVSNGAADFTLSGRVYTAEIKVQNNGSANTEGLIIDDYVFIYQNSTTDLLMRLTMNYALIIIDGSGDVLHVGSPNIIIREGLGTGEIIEI
jgi:hypothetical protein